ncbi:pimeloyl-ACP methyl ester carboxylesterase [Halopolyspora algeriensis]|uniref:Pimeloyl-ACP methyl ester carboxylesterase n=1 Tax=Halopolyspora algeriensis TaxID=1500506 RepID=A0A368VWR3_9ACTN|nr:alpha/beta hydrolase [Halopolyspora algeriensis]RCW46293.1 pimeloyl-ACP methyl ester carboxylesterase [Halopolyspora algeriensis]TQM55693.1 pimeloyl-ACP methyl ester carboxylesterase [Halopolyspora algeriensis]
MAAMSAAPPDEYLVRYTPTPQGRVRSRTIGRDHEHAPPVVSLMGMAVSDYLMPAVSALAEGTQAHLVDLPGLGGSGPATQPLDVAGYARSVCAWLDAAELPPVVLIGNSSSTQVAAHVAAMRPHRVCALVLASPTVDPTVRSWPRLLFFWRRDSQYPLPGLQQQHTPEWVRAGMRQLLHLISVHLKDRLDDVIGTVRCPVLVLRGDHDRISTEAWARRIAELAADGRFAAMPGPHSFVWASPTAWCEPIRLLAAEARQCDSPEGTRD